MHPDQLRGCLGAQTQSTWVAQHLDQQPRHPHLKPQVGAHQDQLMTAPVHRPKARDPLRNPINGLAACWRPQPKKALVLKTRT